MPLAKDLNDLIHRYGGAIAAAAESVLQPRHRPGDPLPDLTDIEKCRSVSTGKPFHFFVSQKEKIAGALAGLKAHGRVWMVCDCGSGKSPMSLAAAWSLLKKKPFRMMVLSPAHIARKWKRECELLLPGVHCKIIRNFTDLLKFEDAAKDIVAPMVAVIGKETAKLGFDVDRPCAARRKMKLRVRLESPSEMQPGDTSLCAIKSGDAPLFEVTRIVDAACCPKCGAVVYEGDDSSEPVIYDEYIARNEPSTCKQCGDRLLTNARGFRKNPHLDRYIQRKMRRVFGILCADECHELASPESAQGNAFGTLAAACRYTIALSGTLLNGTSVSLHSPLWKMSPDLLQQRGFCLQNLKGRISAIARNERAFAKKYGVTEYKVFRNVADDYTGRIQRGACGRRKSYKTDERPRPGINPDLFNHFLLDRAVFMSLDELGPALPSLERTLVPCQMSPLLAVAYRKLDDDSKNAIKRRVSGKGPPGLAAARVQVLDAYLDHPFGWNPIMTGTFDEHGLRCGTETVAWPADLGEDHADTKDTKLVEIVQAELKQGRRVTVYVQFTGVHDVRPKLLKLLTDAGVRALAMPDTVRPETRETWIEKHVDEMDVLIVHPKRVMTGLDLIAFPTLIFYGVGYSTAVLRQASARARRPTQTLSCSVYYLFYADTIQQQAMSLMAEKEAASQAFEGTFDTNALRAMMNGGENDDILAALATTLEAGKKIDARAAWNVPKPKRKPKPAIIRPEPRCWQEGFLFDMDFTPAALAASGE